MQSLTSAMISPAVTTKGIADGALTRYAIIGNGWRSSVFLRLAYLFPERFRVIGVVTRRSEAGDRLEREWGVPTFRTLDELIAAERPDFVIPSVPRATTPDFIRALVERKLPVLTETPPAADLDGLRALWSDVGSSGLVQVAEQYALMPLHAARITIAQQGVIGTPSSVQISSTHLYHAVSLMRAFLAVDIGPARVLSQTFRGPLVDPISFSGWTHDTAAKDAGFILSTIDFGDGRMGLYDFTDNQWWNPVRPDHLTVRGPIGEIHDETVVRMVDDVSPVVSRIERAMTGQGMNYEGSDLTHLSFDGRLVFRNRFEGGRLADDDIAVAELLQQMGAWVRDEGPAPYPLAQGIHDHHVSLAIVESARTRQPVTISPEAWPRV